MKRNNLNYIVTIIGFVMFIVGVYYVKTTIEPQGIMRALPYVLIGLGCGAFGHGMGEILSSWASKHSPDLQKKLEIDKNDERNIVIANRGKAKAYDMMVFVFGALMIALSLMGIDIIALLLLVFSYLFVMGYGVYYRWKFDKEM